MAYEGRTDDEGWPLGTTPELKAWLSDRAQEFFTRGEPRHAELHVVYGWINGQRGPDPWQTAALLDWRYAAVERALRAAGARQVWALVGAHHTRR